MSVSWKTLAVVFGSLLATAPRAWGLEASGSAADEVRAQVVAFNRAYELNELESYFDHYCEDATMWINTEFVSVSAYREDWSTLIGAGGAVLQNTVSDISIQTGPGGDSAVASYRLEIETRQPSGQVIRDRAQETDAWFKSGEKWCVAHLHYSFQTQD